MDFLRVLEGLRVSFMDTIMAGVTRLGGEDALLIIALIVLWCVNKRTGYLMLVAGYAGLVVNQFLKLVFRIERPWVLDPNFTIVEAAREEATGYSFPSGHSTNIMSVAGSLFLTSKKKWFKIMCVVSIALVAFSRMYLGVHTPKDVIVGLAVAAGTLTAASFLFKAIDRKPAIMTAVLMGIVVTAGLFLLYALLWRFPEDISAAELESGRKNGAAMLGAALGLCAGYLADARWIKYKTEANIPAQAIKFILGLALLMGIRMLVKEPLVSLMGLIPGTAVRYFIMMLFGTAIWPITFKYIARIGGKANDISQR